MTETIENFFDVVFRNLVEFRPDTRYNIYVLLITAPTGNPVWALSFLGLAFALTQTLETPP